MAELNDIERARLKNIDDNRKISVRDLLRMAIDEIDRGEESYDGCVLLLVHRPDGAHEKWSSVTYRANIDGLQEIAWHEVEKAKALDRWID
jgi:hypothetical protein